MKFIKMSKSFMVFMLIFLTSSVALAELNEHGTSGTYRTGWVPYYLDTLINPCNGENIAISASYSLTETQLLNNSGRNNIISTFNLRGTGVGLTTGSKYILSSTDIHTGHYTYAENGARTVISNIHGMAISLDKEAPDFKYSITYRSVTDPNGNLRVYIDEWELDESDLQSCK